MKECDRCKQLLPEDLFPKERRGMSHRKDWCLACREEYALEAKRTLKERERLYRQENRDKLKSLLLQKTYGISLDDYNEMVSEQGGRCIICGSAPPKLVVDHDHLTGKVRGLLCMQCNMGLGSFKDNPDALYNAIQYLRQT